MTETKHAIYRTESEKLFSQWKATTGTVCLPDKRSAHTFRIDHQNSIFVRDGVVCPEIWFSQNIRPLYLLKEAYGGNADWDLTQDHLLTSRTASKMWKRISLWTKGLLATTSDELPPYQPNDPTIERYGNAHLKQLAIINIKKSGGQRSSDMNAIRAYAEFDRQFLRRQLELCDPTVIICGYTGAMLEQIMESEIRIPHNDSLFYYMSLNGHDVLVLDFWHPANQYPDLMNYYSLLSVYQQALKAHAHSSI